MRNRNTSRTLATFFAAAIVLAAGAAAAAPNNALKDLMKGMGSSAAADDLAALKATAGKIKAAKPGDAEYAGWDAIADKLGSAGDMAAAKATCKDCHNQYRDKYKAKYGSKAP